MGNNNDSNVSQQQNPLLLTVYKRHSKDPLVHKLVKHQGEATIHKEAAAANFP
jgi:hypothetical protein